MARIRFLGGWNRGAYASNREVDIKGTPFAANLSERQLWPGRHLFTVEMIVFDEEGDDHDGQILTGTATTARLARLAAEQAVRQIANGGLRVVR